MLQCAIDLRPFSCAGEKIEDGAAQRPLAGALGIGREGAARAAAS